MESGHSGTIMDLSIELKNEFSSFRHDIYNKVDGFSKLLSPSTDNIHGLIHHPWLNPDQRLKGNLHEQANDDRNDRLNVSLNWRVGEKLVWLEG
ncbi:hypothetical protein AVEN_181187-1 [Araneus ventricosus]|uniref:Uncharacterized protein n=1 Tax=Araneus ventricosus TaxID=182803 RepID=A0A4Y2PFE5_ARAVE|nr:hypothetical protein AVEN_27130-1 [Araneus ventricosus]GBN36286.1 hypothetical protein AVEN_252189-1 [Araneus ventricosus]GBN50718.1 hypothetical protein AVEN_122712-1 [Araneus ventricosus]GBN50795.1 hypothetical protein AVEN_181187-1 [Araneus ventricosus]